MQWTPFGRVGQNLDDIPRAKLLPRREADGNSFEDWARRAREEATAPAPTDGRQPDGTPSAPAASPQSSTKTAEDVPANETTGQPPTSPETSEEVVAETESASGRTPDLEIEHRGSTEATPASDSRPLTVSFATKARTEIPQATSANSDIGKIGSPPVVPPTVRASQAPAAIVGETRSPKVAKLEAARAHPVRTTIPVVVTEAQHRAILRRIALAATETGGEMRLLLEPKHLGSLGVRIVLDGAGLKLELRAERQEVAALLQGDAETLRRELEQQGLDVHGFDIGTSSRERQQHAQREFEERLETEEHVALGMPGATVTHDASVAPTSSDRNLDNPMTRVPAIDTVA
ncbi:MAG: flagellar hook-length control protein FliK [Planctomycetes bacterium]|nr:flagellar hook-length control protein FliK [Planctomycetota bacterium]